MPDLVATWLVHVTFVKEPVTLRLRLEMSQAKGDVL